MKHLNTWSAGLSHSESGITNKPRGTSVISTLRRSPRYSLAPPFLSYICGWLKIPLAWCVLRRSRRSRCRGFLRREAFKFHENWLQYRTLVEALEREKVL